MVIENVGFWVWLPIVHKNFKSVLCHASFIFISEKLEEYSTNRHHSVWLLWVFLVLYVTCRFEYVFYILRNDFSKMDVWFSVCPDLSLEAYVLQVQLPRVCMQNLRSGGSSELRFTSGLTCYDFIFLWRCWKVVESRSNSTLERCKLLGACSGGALFIPGWHSHSLLPSCHQVSNPVLSGPLLLCSPSSGGPHMNSSKTLTWTFASLSIFL